jgi:hypothetical protein
MENNYSIHNLESLTAEEIKNILELNRLRAEAEADFGLIKSKIKFKIGEGRVTIWNDGNNAEYVTHDGVWQARYLHQTYDVDCSIEGIFKSYKEAYFNKNTTTSAGYFRSFVRGLREGKYIL